MKTIFITKYALSHGIIKMDAVEEKDEYSYSCITTTKGAIPKIKTFTETLRFPKDFCYTMEEAKKKLELMKPRKINVK